MKTSRLLALLLLASPLAALAQTKPTTTTTPSKTTTTTTTKPTTTPAGTQQQTEVTEDLDPETGKVIRRTTRTINVPVGTTASPTSTSPSSTTTMDAPVGPATDAQVTAFLRKKTTVSTLTTTGLLSAYELFMERVRSDRANWTPTNWANAAAIMSALNDRYQQLRSSFSLDDKLTIRSQQGEFQALRTAKQISTQVSDKL
ncbi:hypothetical protein [Hymenobacter negativus]|uniref:Uncharacterized protein n=1 Tax=Hymenobacter negativus TaxID=2795026 RepID=A0ABS0Q4Q0_9BACT|nr:hypothetical protein [Hymenobacter negativus]MBH8557545.1 hypothetical protein [Hymenobacter negativus]